MGVSYSDIENKQNANAEQQQADYNARSNKNARHLANQIAIAVDQATSPVKTNGNGQIAAIPGQYQQLYDANAVQDAVARKLLQQAAGGSDGTLNSTQNAALTAQRGNADVNARLQQQAASQNLSDTLQALLADATAGKIQQQAAAHYQASSDQANFQTALNQLTAQKILNLYSGALQQQYNADQLAEQKSQQDAQLQESARQANADNQYNYDTLDFQKQHDIREEKYEQEQAAKQQRILEQAIQNQVQAYLKNNIPASESGTQEKENTSIDDSTVRDMFPVVLNFDIDKEKVKEVLDKDEDLYVLPQGFPAIKQIAKEGDVMDSFAIAYAKEIKNKVEKGEITEEQGAQSIIAKLISVSPEYNTYLLNDKKGGFNENDTTVAKIGYTLREAGLKSAAQNYYNPLLHTWYLPVN